jgi:Domain of unknown function (DUF4856)
MKIIFNRRCAVSVAARSLLVLVGCQGPTGSEPIGSETGTSTEVPGVYDFDSRFTDGSSVDYSGQVFRQLLVHDLSEYVEGLTERIDQGYFPVDGEVTAALGFYLDFDSATSGGLGHGYTSDPAPAQLTYDQVATGKDLAGKIAGNDPEGQHVDWSVGFRGWTPGATPEGLVRDWFAELDAAAVDRSNGVIPVGPDGAPVGSVAVSADGLHRGELVQKFLYGALCFSQAADDYLDDDIDGMGLLADHSAPAEDGAAYTALEHAWDEGFGYFGAGRDALGWDLSLLGGDAYSDSFVADGAIDLQSEVSWGVARYAARRDEASVVPTDFRGDILRGFIEGRAVLAASDGALDTDELADLQAARDRAVAGWEAVLAASAVHYVNETLVDLGRFGTPEYDFVDHAAHWSELKGLALALQFNPRSAVNDADFDTLHTLIGLAPVLPDADPAEVAAHRVALLEARALLGDRFGFAIENLGDDDGANGW